MIITGTMKTTLDMIGKISEKSYRRGFQQGVIAAQAAVQAVIPVKALTAVDELASRASEWRYSDGCQYNSCVAAPGSSFTTTVLERLKMEHPELFEKQT